MVRCGVVYCGVFGLFAFVFVCVRVFVCMHVCLLAGLFVCWLVGRLVSLHGVFVCVCVCLGVVCVHCVVVVCWVVVW